MDMDGIQRQAEEMAQLEADIMDVNIIFKDLNEMVMDQGTTLGTLAFWKVFDDGIEIRSRTMSELR